MLKSMTGYGYAQKEKKKWKVLVEARSLNSKFFDLAIRLPKELQLHERDIRSISKKYATRGKVTVTVFIDFLGGTLAKTITSQKTREIVSLLNDINRVSGLKDDVRLCHVISLLLKNNSEYLNVPVASSLWKDTKQAVQEAILDMEAMKAKEGKMLQKEFEMGIQRISHALEKIKKLSERNASSRKERLRKNVKQLLFSESAVREDRLELELLLIAKSFDITEECVRLKSHNAFFLETLKSKKEIGKRLNFLVQEQSREITTIAAKSQDVQISKHVVYIKEEVEKLKEQIQNIA